MKDSSKKNQPIEFPWDRTKPYHLLTFLRPVFWLLSHLLYSVRIVGRENLPKKSGGIILVCNHLSMIDPALLAVYTRLNWRFMGKAEIFSKSVPEFLMRHSNAFPMDRDNVDRRALNFALEVMQASCCDKRLPGLGIFPEGTRSQDGTPGEGKTGVAMIARKTKADILPSSIYYEGKLKFRSKITVRFGEMIAFAELGLGETPKKQQNREATDKIMAAITSLWRKGHA